MELKRFFVEPESVSEGEIIISNNEYNHIVNVMRYKKGYSLILCDGSGYDYYCIIDKINNNEVLCSIERKELNKNNSEIKVNLFAALIKEDNYELMIQKAVELGVNSITPIVTKYVSENKIRIDRLNKIALEASKQCGRATLVKVNESIKFEEIFDRIKSSDIKLLAYEKERVVSLKELIRDNQDINSLAIIIGPEGGFCEEEIKTALHCGVRTFSLGRRILRAETASIAVLANIMYELDK